MAEILDIVAARLASLHATPPIAIDPFADLGDLVPVHEGAGHSASDESLLPECLRGRRVRAGPFSGRTPPAEWTRRARLALAGP